MQCLFCGKELALLKRLRGGGEFCSEAHRKEYQEQYEQLALARLLQAKPPSEPAAPLGRTSAPVAPDPDLPQPQVQLHPAVATVKPPASSQSGSRKPAEEASPAPLAGFLSDPVVPAVTPFEQAGLLELDNEWERVTAPPNLSALASADSPASALSDAAGGPPPAPRVELALSLRALEHHTRMNERGLEVREFTGPAPVMELKLRPETGSEPAGAADVMEILMSPHPPQKAKPWLGVPRVFPAGPAELGDLARLDFATTGFAYSDGPPATQAAVLAPEVPQAPPQVLPGAPQQSPVYAEPAPEAFVAPAEPAASAESLAAEPAPPALVTKPLAVTLHGLAAPRGKLVQPYPSAIAAAADVQIPPSAALPLRPAIVFGPAPAPPAATTPATEKPEARSRPSVVPAPKPVPIKRTVAPESPVQEKVQERIPERNTPKTPERRVEPRVEPPKEWPAPKPLEAAAASATAIPSLRLEATESAWSKLSSGLKIGVAAAVIVAVSGIGYVVTRGNGKPTSAAPATATAPSAVATGVPISGGWIDDWANAARSNRHVSVLSGSAKLSDYRLEFQAQIETKAIGWIFRALNPRNYYVTKLETIKAGLEPTIALVHFAVVDGQDESRVVVPLPLKVRVDTTYKIRFDAVGNHFITWVQDQKVDEWTDNRFGSGGVGFFSERDEKAAMQGTVNVVPLVPKN